MSIESETGDSGTELERLRSALLEAYAEQERLRTELERLRNHIREQVSAPPARAAAVAQPDAAASQIRALTEQLFEGIPQGQRHDVRFFDRLFRSDGPLRSTAAMSADGKLRDCIFFQHRDKAEATLCATSAWYGGDYFEFGCVGLNTFRDMLSAFDLFNLQQRFPDTRFCGFDIFGQLESPNTATQESVGEFDRLSGGYFSQQFPDGDVYRAHMDLLTEHGLFRDQCRLVQGYFQDTLTPALKTSLKAERRSIGYAFLDCNIAPSYKHVFEFIFDLMAPNSYIYMDEYFQSAPAIQMFQQFRSELKEKRNMGCEYVRNAGAFGGLFRLFPYWYEERLVLTA